MPRTMLSISASDSAGRARRRLSRARLLTPSSGPTLRASQPPRAEAASSGSSRKKAKAMRANAPSVQSRMRLPPRRSTMCRPLQRAREQRVERPLVLPFDRQRQVGDARAPGRREAHPIFLGGDQFGFGLARGCGELFELARAVRMVIGEAAGNDDLGAGAREMIEEFLRPADAGEGHQSAAGEFRPRRTRLACSTGMLPRK